LSRQTGKKSAILHLREFAPNEAKGYSQNSTGLFGRVVFKEA
jgi:hypothetical protein